MPKAFDHIDIIYNSESTGDAPQLAEKLAEDLTAKGFSPHINHTKRPKHAIEIAEAISLKYKRPLIVSVSGDGGYNEVINGAMHAKIKNKHAAPVVTVLGAGNANDHYRVMQNDPLIELITEHKVKPMDLISIKATAKNFELERYAHSYIGFGITPEVGDELNRHKKSRFNEIKLVLRTFMKFEPFTVIHEGRKRLCDNIVFANINEMAKFIQLDDENTVNDDRFEVIEFAHHGKLSLLLTLLRAALFGIKNSPSYQTYSFETVTEMALQADGEIESLPGQCLVTIKSHGEAIESLY